MWKQTMIHFSRICWARRSFLLGHYFKYIIARNCRRLDCICDQSSPFYWSETSVSHFVCLIYDCNVTDNINIWSEHRIKNIIIKFTGLWKRTCNEVIQDFQETQMLTTLRLQGSLGCINKMAIIIQNWVLKVNGNCSGRQNTICLSIVCEF